MRSRSTQGAASEPPPDLNAFNFKSILRLSNSLTEKHKKQHAVVCTTRSREGTELRHCCDKLRSPLQFRGVPATHRGRSARLLRRRERHIATNGAKAAFEGEQLQRVFEDNGSPVELGLFSSPAYSEISAVIFSSCATFGKGSRTFVRSESEHYIHCRSL